MHSFVNTSRACSFTRHAASLRFVSFRRLHLVLFRQTKRGRTCPIGFFSQHHCMQIKVSYICMQKPSKGDFGIMRGHKHLSLPAGRPGKGMTACSIFFIANQVSMWLAPLTRSVIKATTNFPILIVDDFNTHIHP